MLKRILASKRGEGYVDIAVSIICIVMVLAVALSIFQVIVIKSRMDRMTEDLIECATYAGAFDSEFRDKVDALEAQYGGDIEITYGAPRYFNAPLKRVQLGNDMYVTVTMKVNLFGVETIFPLELSATRDGKSEQYWR